MSKKEENKEFVRLLFQISYHRSVLEKLEKRLNKLVNKFQREKMEASDDFAKRCTKKSFRRRIR